MAVAKTLAIAGISSVVVVIAFASMPSVICACGSAAINFAITVLADPMKSDPVLVRSRLLKALPEGSTIEDVRKFAVSISPLQMAHATPCAPTPTGITCRFLVSGTMWRDSGFELHFALDSTQRVSNVQISRF